MWFGLTTYVISNIDIIGNMQECVDQRGDCGRASEVTLSCSKVCIIPAQLGRELEYENIGVHTGLSTSCVQYVSSTIVGHKLLLLTMLKSAKGIKEMQLVIKELPRRQQFLMQLNDRQQPVHVYIYIHIYIFIP